MVVAVVSDWIKLGWLMDNVLSKLLLKVMEMALINILLPTKHVLNMLGAQLLLALLLMGVQVFKEDHIVTV